jgi:hypothetical protein
MTIDDVIEQEAYLNDDGGADECRDCQAKQEQIDKLRKALAGMIGGDHPKWLDHIEEAAKTGYYCFWKSGEEQIAAVKALRETKP